MWKFFDKSVCSNIVAGFFPGFDELLAGREPFEGSRRPLVATVDLQLNRFKLHY